MRKIISIFLITLLIINVAYVTSGVLFYPIKSIDALGIWLLKAKAIFLGKDLFINLLRSPKFSYSSQDYPILLPAGLSLIYKIFGGINEKLVLLLYPLFYITIIFLVYQTLKAKTSSLFALFFTYLYSMFSPLLGQGGRGLAGNADIVIVLLAWLIIYLLYSKSTKRRLYFLPVIIAVASQIKFEGIFLTTLLFFSPLKKTSKTLLLLISVLPLICWIIFIKLIIVPPFLRFNVSSFAEFPSRSMIIIAGIAREMINIKNWYIFWPIFALSLFIKCPLSKTTKLIIVPSLLLMSFFFFIIYLFSTTPLNEYVSCSIDRILFQLSPLIFLIFFEKSLFAVKKLFEDYF